MGIVLKDRKSQKMYYFIKGADVVMRKIVLQE